MTPKQEKFLTEKFIRPMVKKMLREDQLNSDLEYGFDNMARKCQWLVRRLKQKFSDSQEVSETIRSLRMMLDQLEKKNI